MRLRFWWQEAAVNLAFSLGASVLYGLLMALQMNSAFTGLVSMLPFYMLMFGIFVNLGMCLTVYRTAVPLSLSFGSTRRETIVGLQVYHLLPAVGIPALAGLICALPGSDVFLMAGEMMALGVGLFLLLTAVGILLGGLHIRFGVAASVVTGVALVIIAVGGGIVGILVVSDQLKQLLFGCAQWIVLTVGAVAYGLAFLLEKRIVRRYAVKL